MLKEKYEKEIIPKLMKEFGIKNKMEVPKVTKVLVNTGIGDLIKNKEGRKQIVKDLAKITGQMPQIRPAKLSVAGFNVRQGMPVGLRSTLRGSKMYYFLQRFFSIVLPRLRDFRGSALKSFDEGGNYTLGIVEHTVFPEVDFSKAPPRGLEVTIVTSTKDKDKAKRLLELLGMPFEKEKEN